MRKKLTLGNNYGITHILKIINHLKETNPQHYSQKNAIPQYRILNLYTAEEIYL
jgi:hypothetical protein